MWKAASIFVAAIALLPACGFAEATGKLRDFPLPNNRRYLLYVPDKLDEKKPTPLVVMLHGAGGSAEGSAYRYGWSELADKEHFLVALPEGTRPDMTQPARFADNPRIWNDGSGRGFPAKRKIDDVNYIRRMLDDIALHVAVDPSRVFCTGFSNGASMTYRVGIELSDRFAAIAPISGHLWIADPKPARPLPLFFLTGDADPLNPMGGGDAPNPWGGDTNKPPIQRSIDTWVKLLGVDPNAAVIQDDEVAHAVRYGKENESEVVFYTVKKLGHEWPGHPRVLPETLTGPSSDKIDATKLVWEFFKHHPASPAK